MILFSGEEEGRNSGARQVLRTERDESGEPRLPPPLIMLVPN